MKTVADQFVETLAAGVKRVYGVVGDSLNALTFYAAVNYSVFHGKVGPDSAPALC